jgi:uncharacterized protein (TIGR00255 family)
MTGFGRGEASGAGVTVAVEIRSVNNRFLDVATRLPRTLSTRENDIKEVVRRKISRGKITVVVSTERPTDGAIPIRVNVAAAKAYHRLLKDLRKAVKLKETVKMEHLLQFSDILEQDAAGDVDEQEWRLVEQALEQAVDGLIQMRKDEGGELGKDLGQRISTLDSEIDRAESLSKAQIPAERERLRERALQLMSNTELDEGRLEMELVLLADKLDITEECVRFRSHNKFFREALRSSDAAGRKLGFLVQEMNREANTIGSKSSSAEIAHLVVGMKEELEKIREQLQNVE